MRYLEGIEEDIEDEIRHWGGKVGMAGRYKWSPAKTAEMVHGLRVAKARKLAAQLRNEMRDFTEDEIQRIREVFAANETAPE